MDTNFEALQFNRFRLEPDRRRLLVGGTPVALSSRAYDLLEFLVKNRNRVVTRDEIVSHVWQGMAVGENNLSVQMSLLRRALAEHAGKEPLIVNLPGRGYRFVGDVTVAMPARAPGALRSPEPPIQEPSARTLPTRARQPRQTWLITAGGMFILLFLLLLLTGRTGWMPSWSSPSPVNLPDARLSIAVAEFTAVGNDPRTPALAADYTQAILARFGQFDDLVLFPDHEPVRPKVPAHFRLTGSVQVNGAETVIMTRLTEAADGKLLYRGDVTMVTDATVFQQSATAMEMLLDMRPSLFRAEFALRRGPARDALDLLIESHVADGEAGKASKALSLAEQAIQRDPTNTPARVLLSTLLTDDMLSLPATSGDEDGRRALSLINSVLLEQPRNFLFIERRAFALQALGRLNEAQATAESGLRIQPACDTLIQTLGEILMQQGDLVRARTLIKPVASYVSDDRIATLEFAEGRYAEALVETRRIIAAAPGDWNMQFTTLLEVAILSQIGKLGEAEALLIECMKTLPKDFGHVGAQRQSLYELPDDAWHRFKEGLVQAGMPP